jgi:hypothetical protein
VPGTAHALFKSAAYSRPLHAWPGNLNDENFHLSHLHRLQRRHLPHTAHIYRIVISDFLISYDMLIDTPSSTRSFLGAQSSFSSTNSDDLCFTYLTATTSYRQPLCGNAEGWGPLSPFRYDFTPCFLDVWISTVAVFGIVFGTGAVWWLFTRKDKAEVAKDWHFWTKLVSDGLS